MDEIRDDRPAEKGAEEQWDERVRRRRFRRPRADIYATDEEIIVLVDVPGLEKESLTVALEGDDLLIDGPVPDRREAESALPWGYHRRFRLRSAIDRGRIGARLESGVLRITLPRAVPKREEVPVE